MAATQLTWRHCNHSIHLLKVIAGYLIHHSVLSVIHYPVLYSHQWTSDGSVWFEHHSQICRLNGPTYLVNSLWYTSYIWCVDGPFVSFLFTVLIWDWFSLADCLFCWGWCLTPSVGSCWTWRHCLGVLSPLSSTPDCKCSLLYSWGICPLQQVPSSGDGIHNSCSNLCGSSCIDCCGQFVSLSSHKYIQDWNFLVCFLLRGELYLLMLSAEVGEQQFKGVLVVGPQNKCIVHISPPHLGYEGGRAEALLLLVFHVDVDNDRREGDPIAAPSICSKKCICTVNRLIWGRVQ